MVSLTPACSNKRSRRVSKATIIITTITPTMRAAVMTGVTRADGEEAGGMWARSCL